MPALKKKTPSVEELAVQRGLHDERLGFRVRLLHLALSRRVEEALQPFGLRPGSLTIMVLISANAGYSQAELARMGLLDKSALVAIIDDLETQQLAIRGRVDGDRRRNSLHLTEKGEEVMRRMHAAALETERQVVATFSAAEYSALFDLLDRAYAAIEDPS
jgi:DNA-binding MarR family transcriptional regulator